MFEYSNNMKREHDNDDGGQNRHKRPRADGFMEALNNGKFELRLLVSTKSAGAIIGKGGENIKRLRSEFDAHVQVPDSNSPDRIVTIVAPDSVVLNVVRDIIPRLEEAPNDRDPCELRILIHQSHAGGLIGRSGSKIKELREKCSARLKIFSMCCPNSTDRVLSTCGESENVLKIVDCVIQELKEIPIKGNSTPYSPFNYDPIRSHEYGGYGGNTHGGPGGGMPGGPPSHPPRRGPGPAGDYGGPGGYRPPPPPPNNNYPPMHGGAGFGPPPPPSQGGANGGGYSGSGAPNSNYGYGPGGAGAGSGGPVTTAQVTIPSDLGGTIIGRGGERIARIRQDSGAQITLEQATGQPERIITITGTEQQIHTAQYLLQQCVRNSQQGRERFGGSHH
ncbi:unnamed protein product [Caenorhabditis angaria]|uniref:K Homology domain-containing protein n=1 Tax=Caenorhabditis angaria TaxID=860376 RepID=A0A9P1I6X8_9PELO|nr:unnamed protein product [Caenorhabditis angaria]